MSDDILIAAKGFSANGVSMQAGQPHVDQFDAQTVAVLVKLGRLVSAPAEEADDEIVTKGKKNRAVLPGTGEGAGAPAGGGLPGVGG